jgi:hypothetical protein
VLGAAIALTAFAASARADSSTYTLTVHNEFGQQLSDVGRTRIDVTFPTGGLGTTHFGCDPSVARAGNQIVITRRQRYSIGIRTIALVPVTPSTVYPKVPLPESLNDNSPLPT